MKYFGTKKVKTIGLFFLLCIFSLSASPGAGDTFTGVGSSTTATFTSSGIVKVEWTTTSDSPTYALFSAYIYEQGDSIFKDLFGGLSGTTYYYDDGTLYFDVSAANLNSWSITTSDTAGEYGTSFSGSDSKNTKLFTGSGNVKITWTTTYDSETFALFSVYTYELGNSIFADMFSGLSGETYLYESGTFYFDVSAANLNSWSITVEDIGGDTSQDDETQTPTTQDGGVQTPTSSATAPAFVLASIFSVLCIVSLRRRNTKHQAN
ncbi:MAG: hypothetical protein ACE5OZ_11340 [Candidatus Heimdallarchaeota archaeon]